MSTDLLGQTIFYGLIGALGVWLVDLYRKTLERKRMTRGTLFTWWTYYIAKRRAFKREYDAFMDHYSAVRGPEEWRRAMRLTRLIQERKVRERSNICKCGHGEGHHWSAPTNKWGVIFQGDCQHYSSYEEGWCDCQLFTPRKKCLGKSPYAMK